MKTCVCIDSTAYMSVKDLEKSGLKVIPLSVIFDDVVYSEHHDDGKQIKEVFRRIEEVKNLPSTSQPTNQDAADVFKACVEEGYKRIIVLTITEELSGTYQGIMTSANQFMEENKVQIEVYSSKSAAQVSGVMALEVKAQLDIDNKLSPDAINNIIDHYRKLSIFFFVDNLDYLAYGGRIPQSLASIGNIFGVTPILTLSETGAIEKFGTERSFKNGLKKVLTLLERENFTPADEIILMVAHTDAEKKAKKILKMATLATEATIVKNEVSNMGIVIGNHIGPGAVGIGWVKVYKK